MNTIRVASRTSQLAMTQTNWVIDRLTEILPGTSFEVVPIRTKGDQILDVTLSKIGGKGLFVSEIEHALLHGEADIAVHSMKDVPYELAPGLQLAGIPKREDPRDVVISASGLPLNQLPNGARVGTSSLRRVTQLRMVRPDFHIEPLRGNIDTRLRRVREGEFDAIVLAAAGLHRMGWQGQITEYLPPDVCLPAIGQGVLAVECRESDADLVAVLRRWSDRETVEAVTAERALLHGLQGSCQIPIGGYATLDDSGVIHLTGLVADPDGDACVRESAAGTDPVQLGKALADKLLSLGADEWIAKAEARLKQDE
ncbi:hydroxymethylbilane synthase [Alicyclobacillus acidiphilus]|uniref:hydroxymethylbilane synthase n=1 Tax=Alicyclobacillus acidiphilus TaxID=182455 RepID=UPI00082A51E4|nr:hydroxymethylbilane synthase [Alicyclobacillus acidiphilus]